MKTTLFESIYNREKFTCSNLRDIRTIDGIDYLRVFRFGTNQDVLVRKEFLKKIPNK